MFIRLMLLALCTLVSTCKQRNSASLSNVATDVNTKRFPSPTRSGIEVGLIYNQKLGVFCRGLCREAQGTCEAELQAATVAEIQKLLLPEEYQSLITAFGTNTDLTVPGAPQAFSNLNKFFQDRYEQKGIQGTEVCRDVRGNLSSSTQQPMPSFKFLLGRGNFLVADMILSFIANYPSVFQSVDDFVSLIAEFKLVVNMQIASHSMCESYIDAAHPRPLVASGDVVIAYNAPGTEHCGNKIEMMRINHLETFTFDEAMTIPKATGKPNTKQSYDFFLAEAKRNGFHMNGTNTQVGCDQCHLRKTDQKFVPIWAIFAPDQAGIWPGTASFSGIASKIFARLGKKEDTQNPQVLKMLAVVKAHRRYRFVIGTEYEDVRTKIGPGLAKFDNLFRATGALSPLEFGDYKGIR